MTPLAGPAWAALMRSAVGPRAGPESGHLQCVSGAHAWVRASAGWRMRASMRAWHMPCCEQERLLLQLVSVEALPGNKGAMGLPCTHRVCTKVQSLAAAGCWLSCFGTPINGWAIMGCSVRKDWMEMEMDGLEAFVLLPFPLVAERRWGLSFVLALTPSKCKQSLPLPTLGLQCYAYQRR